MTVYKKVESDKGILTIMYDRDGIDPRDNDNLATMVCSQGRYSLGDEQARSIHEYGSWQAWAEGELGNLEDYVILPLYLYDHSGITMRTTSFSCSFDSGQVGWIYCSKERFLQETAYSAKTLFGNDPNAPLEVGDYVTIEGVSKDHFGKVESISDGNVAVDWTYLYIKDKHDDPSLKGVYPIETVKLVTEYAKTMLMNEVKEYDQYLRGDVYGYSLEEKVTLCDGGCNCKGCSENTRIVNEEIDSCWGFFGTDFKTNGLLDNIQEEFRHLVDQL